MLVTLGITAIETLRGDREPDDSLGREGDRFVITLGEAPTAQQAVEETRRNPVREVVSPPVSDEDIHVVRKGETLSSIAKDRLGDARLAGEIARLNGISDPNELDIGQRLRLR